MFLIAISEAGCMLGACALKDSFEKAVETALKMAMERSDEDVKQERVLASLLNVNTFYEPDSDWSITIQYLGDV